MTKQEILDKAFEDMYLMGFKSECIEDGELSTYFRHISVGDRSFREKYIKDRLNTVELMFDYWQDVSDDEFINELYIIEISIKDIFWDVEAMYYYDCLQLPADVQSELIQLYNKYVNGGRREKIINEIIHGLESET